ncbi:hypothetical protein BH09BAC4_BH09BAC4_03040 [soil metagenome]
MSVTEGKPDNSIKADNISPTGSAQAKATQYIPSHSKHDYFEHDESGNINRAYEYLFPIIDHEGAGTKFKVINPTEDDINKHIVLVLIQFNSYKNS